MENAFSDGLMSTIGHTSFNMTIPNLRFTVREENGEVVMKISIESAICKIKIILEDEPINISKDENNIITVNY